MNAIMPPICISKSLNGSAKNISLNFKQSLFQLLINFFQINQVRTGIV